MAAPSGPGPVVREVETKTTRLPLFYGNTPGIRNEVSPKALVQRIEAYCRSTNKPADTECQELYLVLRADGLAWWDTLKHSQVDKGNWVQLRKEFLNDFDYRVAEKSSYRLTTLRQKIGESVVSFFARVSQAVDDMYDGMPVETNQDKLDARNETILHTVKNMFISGLRENLRAAVLNGSITTLKEAKEAAKKAECLQGCEKPKPTMSMWEEVSAVMDTVIEVEDRGEEDDDFHEEEVAAINNWRIRHRRRPVKWTPRRRPFGQPQGPFQGKCHNCDRVGHIARNCKEPRKNTGIRSVDERSPTNEGNAQTQQTQNQHYSLSSIKNW
jgi:hypothetical protein